MIWEISKTRVFFWEVYLHLTLYLNPKDKNPNIKWKYFKCLSISIIKLFSIFLNKKKGGGYLNIFPPWNHIPVALPKLNLSVEFKMGIENNYAKTNKKWISIFLLYFQVWNFPTCTVYEIYKYNSPQEGEAVPLKGTSEGDFVLKDWRVKWLSIELPV